MKRIYSKSVDAFANSRCKPSENFSHCFLRIVREQAGGNRDIEQEVWCEIARRAFPHASAGRWMDSFSTKKDLVVAMRKRRR